MNYFKDNVDNTIDIISCYHLLTNILNMRLKFIVLDFEFVISELLLFVRSPNAFYRRSYKRQTE